MSCDVGEVKERLENELCSFSNLSVTSPTSQLILHPFRRFTYVIAHSPTLPLLHVQHSSFSYPSFASPTSQALDLRHLANRPWIRVGERSHAVDTLSVTSPTSQLILKPFVALPTSHLILQPFRCFVYVTAHSPTLLSLLLRHSSSSGEPPMAGRHASIAHVIEDMVFKAV